MGVIKKWKNSRFIKIWKNRPGTRGQASNGIQEHYADQRMGEWVSRPAYKLPFNLKLKKFQKNVDYKHFMYNMARIKMNENS